MAAAPLVPANWELPSELKNRLGSMVGSQRIMQSDGHLLVIAHDVPDANEMTRRGILYWRDDRGEWKCSNGDPGKAGIEILLNRYEQRIREFDRQESAAQSADDYLHILESLAPVARASKHLTEVLGKAREAFPEAIELIDLRDRAYALSRAAELNYQYTRDDMDVAMIRRAEKHTVSNERLAIATHRLNMMAAFFLPLATLSSVFGTTLTEDWTWAHTPNAFLLMLVVGLLAGIVLTSLVSSWRSEKKN